MSLINTKLYYRNKNYEVMDIKLYDNVNDVGNPHVTLNHNGRIVYAKLVDPSHPNATKVYVKVNGTVWAIAKSALQDTLLRWSWASDDRCYGYISTTPDASGVVFSKYQHEHWTWFEEIQYLLDSNIERYYLLAHCWNGGGNPTGFIPQFATLSTDSFYFEYSGDQTITNSLSHWRASKYEWSNWAMPEYCRRSGRDWCGPGIWNAANSGGWGFSEVSYFISPIIRK